MKHFTLTLTLIAFFLVSCNSNVNRTPRVKEKPEREYGGKVKQIVKYHCEKYLSNKTPLKIVENSCEIWLVKDFNPDGIMTKKKIWDESDYPNDPDHVETVRLDESGQIIEEVTKSSGKFEYNMRENYSYNNDGFRTEHVKYREGNLAYRKVINYDEYNCPIKELTYYENNNLEYYYKNDFDDRNREISSYKYDDNDDLVKKWKFEYQKDNDDWSVRYTYNKNGEIINTYDKIEAHKNNRVRYSYTSGLPGEEFTDVQYYTDGKVKSWHFINASNNDVVQTYDRNGRIVRREIHNKDEWIETYTWKYREDGAVTEESKSTSEIIGKSYYKKTTYYRLDFNGNWIEQYIKDSDGNVTYLAKRKIEYYN